MKPQEPIHDPFTKESDATREARLESLARLAGGLAHDLNNVLTPLLMAVQLLRKDPPLAQRTELLNTARAGVTRGAALVQRLLTLSGTADGDRVPVRPEVVVEKARSLIERATDIHFRTNISPDLWAIVGDEAQLIESLVHLGENARDAVAGSGTVTFTAVNALLTPADLPDQLGLLPGRYVELSVADTGLGIPTEIRGRVFDPFFTTKPFGQGSGLGLALARGIVRSHGGFLRVESEAGHGSRFSAYLPAVEEVVVPPTPARQGPLRGHGETILVIEDEPAISRLARIALEIHGYLAITASSGAEAVDLYSRHRDVVRVVVLDLMMPEMDGAATLKALRAIDPDVRVIVASGRPSNMVGEVQGCLAKPYEPESLVALVHAVLSSPAVPTDPA